jgi:uncharacterized protein (UPF0276 family)
VYCHLQEVCVNFPQLGVGIGLRRVHYDELLETERSIDWLELISENFLLFGGRPRRLLEQFGAQRPLVPHGVALDIGGREGPDPSYVEHLAALADRIDAPFVSDHLVYTRLGGTYTHELLPLPFREEVVEMVAERARGIQARLERPFLLENPSYYAVMPGQQMDEAAFLSRVVERADCGLLLDVNNLYINSENLGYDPRTFLDALPLDRVGYVHLAGHRVDPRAIIDNHGTAVPEPVWALFRELLDRTGPLNAMIEWDLDIPPLDVVLDEADKARAILAEYACE